jgi:hypothetical protein
MQPGITNRRATITNFIIAALHPHRSFFTAHHMLHRSLIVASSQQRRGLSEASLQQHRGPTEASPKILYSLIAASTIVPLQLHCSFIEAPSEHLRGIIVDPLQLYCSHNEASSQQRSIHHKAVGPHRRSHHSLSHRLCFSRNPARLKRCFY